MLSIEGTNVELLSHVTFSGPSLVVSGARAMSVLRSREGREVKWRGW